MAAKKALKIVEASNKAITVTVTVSPNLCEYNLSKWCIVFSPKGIDFSVNIKTRPYYYEIVDILQTSEFIRNFC